MMDRGFAAPRAGGIDHQAAAAEAPRSETALDALDHRDVLGVELVAKEIERLQLRQAWQNYFSEFDVFLMPVQTRTAREHRGLSDEDAFASHLWFAAATVTGLPATTAPAGIGADGLPVGVQILAPH